MHLHELISHRLLCEIVACEDCMALAKLGELIEEVLVVQLHKEIPHWLELVIVAGEESM